MTTVMILAVVAIMIAQAVHVTTRLRRVLDKTTSGKKKDWQQCHSINFKKKG